MQRHTSQKLLELSRQYARRSKWAKRRGQPERARELMALSRFLWMEGKPQPFLSLHVLN